MKVIIILNDDTPFVSPEEIEKAYAFHKMLIDNRYDFQSTGGTITYLRVMYFEGEKALVRDYDLRFCENDPNLLKLLEIWNTPTATKQRNRFELIKSESDLSGSVWLRSLSDNTLENPVSLSSQETYTLFKEGILPDVDEGLIGKYFQTDDLTSLVLTSDNIYSHLLYSGVGNGDIVFGKYPSYACFI